MLAMFLKSPIASRSRCANRFSRSYLFNYNVLSPSPRAGKYSKPESLSPRERAAKRERMVLDIKVKLQAQNKHLECNAKIECNVKSHKVFVHVPSLEEYFC